MYLEKPREDSLRKRYAYKLGANILGIPISLVTQAIVPRVLGPVLYGNFNFLTDFFSQLMGFFATGTSEGFYAKLSQRQRESSLIRFYWGFVLVATILAIVVVLGVFAVGKGSVIWPLQEPKYVWLALLWGLLTWYAQIVLKIVDAMGVTAAGETAKMIQKITALGLLSAMYGFLRFGLTEFFLYQYFIILFLCFAWWIALKRHDVALFPAIRLSRPMVDGYTKEFYHYSAPLVVYALVGLIVGILDRWLLQSFAGSTEQGFYSLSYQLGAVCFLFTSAMTPLITREFAVAFGEQNKKKMRDLFVRYIPMLYSIAAFFSIYVSFNASRVGMVFGGSKFQNASFAIAIMAFYPIHQTYGQLSGAVFLATGQTTLYRNIGITFMLLGLPITYLLLAPPTMLGLNLGAVGLTIKMVCLQFLAVNVQLVFNARYLELPLRKLMFHQIYSIIVLGVIAYLSAAVIDHFVVNNLIAVILSGTLYTVCVIGTLFFTPSVFSLTREELIRLLQRVKERITTTHSP
jgi:O-antigen/teichoic acid export membrane protein